MDTTREKSRTYEEIRDKYFYLVYRIHDRYGLDGDGLSELTIRYCEFIHENLHKDWQWSGRLQRTLENAAEKLLKNKCREAEVSPASLEEFRGTAVSTDGGLNAVLDALCNVELHNTLTQLFDTITPREKLILEMRFFQHKTLRECGESIGCNAERARQIERKALVKLRRPVRAQYLRPFVDCSYSPPKAQDEEAHTFFRYNTPGLATIPNAVSNAYEHVVVAFPSTGSTKFEVLVVSEGDKQYVIRIAANGREQYLHDSSLAVVDLTRATRYDNPLVPIWIADYLSQSGQVPDADGYFKW